MPTICGSDANEDNVPIRVDAQGRLLVVVEVAAASAMKAAGFQASRPWVSRVNAILHGAELGTIAYLAFQLWG